MRFETLSFGSICIDGTTYGYDVVIDRGHIRKRKEKPSKGFRDRFGHTPLSINRGGDTLEVPAACDRHRNRSVAGDGKVNHEAHRRKIKLQILSTAKAIKTLEKHPERTNAILHLTC